MAKVVKMVKDRYMWSDNKAVLACSALVRSGLTAADLNGGWWHKSCYVEFASQGHYDRARRRYEHSQLNGKYLTSAFYLKSRFCTLSYTKQMLSDKLVSMAQCTRYYTCICLLYTSPSPRD